MRQRCTATELATSKVKDRSLAGRRLMLGAGEGRFSRQAEVGSADTMEHGFGFSE